MKLKFLIITVLAIAGLNSIAQEIAYDYDLAGNRTARRVITVPATPEVATVDPEVFNPAVEPENKTEPVVYEDLLADKQLNIYPNPTQGKLTVEITNYDLAAKGSIQVFDMAGRLVQSVSQLSERMEVDITAEPAGSYIMIIVIGSEKSEWKVVKQ